MGKRTSLSKSKPPNYIDAHLQSPGQSRPSMVSWMNPPAANPAATKTVPSAFFFSSPASGSDRAVESVAHRKARAVYPCEAEHSSELSFQMGAIFEDVQFSREPGWLEGTLNGKRGLIPQNYVQFL